MTALPELTGRLLLDPEVIDDPYPFYRRLVADAPVWQVPGATIFVVSSFEGVSQAVNRTKDFSSNIRGLLFRNDDGLPEVLPFGDPGADVLATADPPAHSAHRSAVFPELVARRMATLREEIEELTEARISSTLGGHGIEFMDAIANAIPIRVVSKLIGFQDEDPEQLLAAAFDSTAMLAGTEPESSILGSIERSFSVAGWISDQVQSAIDGTGPRDGILGAIAAAAEVGDLQTGEGFIILHTLLSAGGESTTSLLGSAAHRLATDRELQERLRSDPDLVVPFVEEMTRLESPFRYHPRSVPADTELLGVKIPAGSLVLLFWGAANRDPAEHQRPDELLLDRAAPRHHVGFGRGIHLCVGAPLARLEAQVIISKFLAATSSFKLDDALPPVRVNSLMVRRFERLPLKVIPAD